MWGEERGGLAMSRVTGWSVAGDTDQRAEGHGQGPGPVRERLVDGPQSHSGTVGQVVQLLCQVGVEAHRLDRLRRVEILHRVVATENEWRFRHQTAAHREWSVLLLPLLRQWPERLRLLER